MRKRDPRWNWEPALHYRKGRDGNPPPKGARAVFLPDDGGSAGYSLEERMKMAYVVLAVVLLSIVVGCGAGSVPEKKASSDADNPYQGLRTAP